MATPTTRRALLAAGIAAPLLYAAADAVAGARWDGYSFRDQTISELAAFGAPSRPLFAMLLVIVYALLVGFGAGVREAAGTDRRLWLTGGLIVALGVLALTVGQLASMRVRGEEQGLAGTMHLVEGVVAMVLTFSAMGVAATAFGPRFRRYTIATIVFALLFGAWSAMDVAAVGAGQATPWVGVKERLFWYGYQTWFVVLAFAMLRRDRWRRPSA